MRLIAIGLALGLAAGAASSAAAQGRIVPPGSQGGPGTSGGMERGAPPPPTAEDPAGKAFSTLDGRLSEIATGLKLNPDQQRLWGGVEEAARGVVRQRLDAKVAARERIESRRDSRQAGQRPPPRDIPAELRARADASAGAAEATRRLADAIAPLFESLDDRQRQRLAHILPALAQAGRLASPGVRRGPPPRRGPAAQQPQGPDDDMDDEEPAAGAPPPARR